MGRLLKIVLSLLASVILLIVIVAISLPFFIDPNDFKTDIQTAVKEQTGRELIIEGNLGLSLFPWLGVSTEKISLGNAQGFSETPFIELTSSDIKVKLLPLLSKKIEVNRIIISGLIVNLAKNKQGITNWADLIQAQPKQQPINPTKKAEEKELSPFIALAVGGLSLQQATIRWNDQQQDQQIEITDFNLDIGRLAFNEVIDTAFSLNLSSSSPQLNETLQFSGELIIDESLNQLNLKSIQIESITHIENRAIKVNAFAEIALNLSQQSLNITHLKLTTANLDVLATLQISQITENPLITGSINIPEFNFVELMQSLQQPLPDMQNPTALNKVALNLDFTANSEQLDIKSLVIQLDSSHITGNTQINHFAQPAIHFNLHIDQLNADHYLSPEKAQTKQASSPATAILAGTALFPVETLRNLNLTGTLNIDSIQVNQLNMQGLTIDIDAKHGVIKTKQQVKQFYQGSYSGHSSLNVRHNPPIIALNEKLSHVQVEPLLNDMLGKAKISGHVNASIQATGQGQNSKAIKSSLNGQMSFDFNESVVKGFNLQAIIDRGKSLLKGKTLPSRNKTDQTAFSVIKGTAHIKNGTLYNKDLYAKSSKVNLNGQGNINLVTEVISYKVNAKLIKQQATVDQAEKIRGIPLIIQVAGTLKSPSYQLDLSKMLYAKHSEKLQQKKQKLIKKIDQKLGKGLSKLLNKLF